MTLGERRPTIALATFDVCAPDVVALAEAAEHHGFHRLWLGEHLLHPVGHRSVHPTHGADMHSHPRSASIVNSTTSFADPFVALAAAAARTSSIELATGVYLVPLRHPLTTAQAAATVQDVANGRFSLGIGAGWLAEEFEALGIDFSTRGSRLDEALDILRRAWNGSPIEFEGRHFSVSGVQVRSTPVEIPIIAGGNSPTALRRAVRLGDAWYGSGTPTLSTSLSLRRELEVLSDQSGRQRPLPIHIRIPEARGDCIADYAAHGFDHIVLWADQLWPSRGTPAQRRAGFEAALEHRGLVPWLQSAQARAAVE